LVFKLLKSARKNKAITTCGGSCAACRHGLAYEKKDFVSVTNILKHFENLTGVALDGGAHVGVWSLNLLNWYQKNKITPKIIPIEPSERSYVALWENVSAAPMEIIKKALWSKSNLNIFIDYKHELGPAQDFVSLEGGREEIQTITLDDIYLEVGPIDFLKLDLEGAEFEALKGAKQLLSDNAVKLLMIEFHADRFKTSKVSPWSIVKYLKKFNYVPFSDTERSKIRKCNKGITSTFNVKFILNTLLERMNMIKLNLGGNETLEGGKGSPELKGFINVDARRLKGVDVVADIRKLPFKSKSIDEIRASHVIEHIHVNDIPATLLEWNRVLKIGGILRVYCPDTFKIMQARVTERITQEQASRLIFGNQNYKENIHRVALDRGMLERFLLQVGFQIISRDPRPKSYSWDLGVQCIKIK